MDKSVQAGESYIQGLVSLETLYLNRLTEDDIEVLTDSTGSHNHFIKLSQLRGVALIEAAERNDGYWGVRLDFPDLRSVYLKLWYKHEDAARSVQQALLTLKREDLERLNAVRQKAAARRLNDEAAIRSTVTRAETSAPVARKTGGVLKRVWLHVFK